MDRQDKYFMDIAQMWGGGGGGWKKKKKDKQPT